MAKDDSDKKSPWLVSLPGRAMRTTKADDRKPFVIILDEPHVRELADSWMGVISIVPKVSLREQVSGRVVAVDVSPGGGRRVLEKLRRGHLRRVK